MKRKLLFNANACCSLLFFFCFLKTFGQTATVFSDDFATSAGTNYTLVSGPVGSKWSLTSSGTDYGAKIDAGLMTVTNDATAAANTAGWALASNTSTFPSPYSTTLNINPGDVTWTFNMRQPQANPGGFGSGNYGVAFILAGTAGTTNSTGTGYAVTLGNNGKTDPLKLVRYTAGLQTSSTILQSGTTGLTDFGNPYISVKVVYTPSTNNWQLYVRNDGSVFLDPNSGSLTLQGAAVNSASTNVPLPLMGGFWNSNIKINQAALFDNVKVTVAIPGITSISPPSKVAGTGAFTLTVNGSNFISGSSTVRWNGSARITTYVSATQLTASINAADITSSGTASITVANGAAISNSQSFTIDVAGVPVVSLSTSGLTNMTTITGTASSAQTYTVSASNLTADVTVTAPVNFEISPNGTAYSNTLTLTRTGNVLVGQPVTVYARVKASAASGLYSGTIDHTTTGSATKSISVTATVIAAKPTTQATAVTFTTVTSTTFTVGWTNGNGANHLLVMRSGGAVNANPSDGVIYTGVTSYGGGSEIGTGNYVVYAGSSNTVNVIGLQPNTAYYVAVYDYNGLGGTESYLTTSPATGTKTTLNAPQGWQIYNTNTANTITFDTTVDGVNEGVFQAAGMTPTLTNGELNSNAWGMSGFSDGAIAIGGTSVDGQDFDRGTSTGGVSIGGVYAFETSLGNYSVGIQPAVGDYVPGTTTLRFQNQTGVPINSFSIGYKVYIYNDQPASSNLNFSYSASESTGYSSVPNMVVTSPAAADVAPGWKAYYRVATITPASVIASNAYYYIKWTGATVSGSVDFDEFGIDDIVMVANPTTNFATFSGTAENFVILGNATLSGATSITSDITFNGGKLDLAGNTLTANGTVTNTTTGGLKGSATSNLIVGGTSGTSLSFDQTTLGTTNLLNNFTINTTGATTTTVTTPLALNGTLTTAVGQTLFMGTNALSGNLTTIANDGTITTQNTTSTPISSGKTWGGTGTVIYNAATAQTVVTGTYQNLTISGSGTGTNFPNTVNISGDLTLNQSVSFSGSTVVMTGSIAQVIKGTNAPAFNNLTISNLSGGVSLQTNASLSGTLTLTSGNVALGAYNLILGAAAVSGTFSASNMIIATGTGELRRTYSGTGSYLFPIGDDTLTLEYSPITVAVTAGTFSSAYVGVNVADAIHPNNSSASNNISRYWNVKASGITGGVATITASYTAADLTGTESSISAAQLNGTFSQASNPWLKYVALGGNTLTAAGAVLTSGVTSAFTGIKGATLTTTIVGYGSFCQNEVVTLTAAVTNGDMPYSYLWSGGLGTLSTATPPTTAVGTVNYTLTVKDGNGIAATDNATIVTLAPSQGGTVSSNQSICAGTTPVALTLSGNTGGVLYWQSASDSGFTAPTNISNTTTTLSAAAMGSITATTYFRAVVQNGSCNLVYSAPAVLTVKSTTWNGTAWSNGIPDSVTTAIISGNYTSQGNIAACSLTVDSNATVVIASGNSVALSGAITVSSGSFTLENNASLLQSQNVTNSGNIIVKRNSSLLLRQDYTLWSSPVASQNLLAFSPETVTTRFYNYNSATDLYFSVAPSTTNFGVGQGTLIRMPNNASSTVPTSYAGVFTGIPNNGTIPFTMSNTYNLVGNPYPSPISMSTFVSENSSAITGALYFWRETNFNTLNNAYCSWAGGTFVSNGEAQVYNPSGILQTGQGFFVAAKAGQTALNFNNSQRVANTNNQFFRTADLEERHTLWLNLTDASGLFSQMAVGYITGAVDGVDVFDASSFDNGTIALTSTLAGGNYVIQGRALPFNVSDVVPLGFRTATAGSYTIAIDHGLGIFEGTQPIYLRDLLTNALHDLTAAAYTFVSEAGVFNNRFEIVYENLLSTETSSFTPDSVIVYKQGQECVVDAGGAFIDAVSVFDIQGRLLMQRNNVNAREVRFLMSTTKEVLIVKVTLRDHGTVSRKIVN